MGEMYGSRRESGTAPYHGKTTRNLVGQVRLLSVALVVLSVSLFAYGSLTAFEAPADSTRSELRTLFYKAKAARDNQDWRTAADLYLSLTHKKASNPYRDDATFWYAFCLHKAGDSQAAALAYERYLEEYPSGKYAAAAEARLRNLLDRLPKDEKRKTQQLIERMRARKEKETRRQLIEALSRGSSGQDLPLLITLLQREKDPSLRVFLVQTLGRSGDPTVVPYLVEIARQGNDSQVRQAAILALGRISADNAYLELLNLLNAANSSKELTSIVWSLARSGGAKSLPVLARVARSEEDTQVRTTALREIGHLATPASWDTLLALALDPSLPLALRIRAVQSLPPGLYRTRLDAETVHTLLRAAQSSKSYDFLRAVLSVASRANNSTWEETSRELFSLISPDAPLKINTLLLVSFARRGPGKVPVKDFLALCDRFEESSLRMEVLRVLKRQDPDLAVQGLKRLLQQDQPLPDLDKLVSLLPPDKGVDLLEEALSSDDPSRRQDVVKALAFLAFRAPQATQLLVRTAEKDPDYEVRQAAFQALSKISEPEAQEAVRRLANEFYR